YEVEPPYSGFSTLSTGGKVWYDTNSMTAIGDSLYINQGARVQRADFPYGGCRDLEVPCD
ncbi:MAG: hypothetical protein O7G83_21885, partial [Proteobacteria bacterium]|nr:hypothetical protein [Pseudomonadota bacterium]